MDTWLVHILSNVCKDMLRKRQTHPVLPLEDEVLTTLVDESDGYSMLETLQSLSPEHRTTVILFYLEGYRVRDIAKMLDAPTGTIKSRLLKARTILRQAILDDSDAKGENYYEKA